MTDWCILRVSAPSTIRLAKSLVEAGFDAWTPIETVKPVPHQPREGERRRPPRKLPETITRPLYQTFVFARADRLLDLIALAHSPSLTYQVWDSDKRRMVLKGHPYFTLFRYAGTYPTIPDAALDPVRKIAARRKPRGKPREFKPGDRVKLTEGAWAGLNGVVRRKAGKLLEVVFEGFAQSAQFHPDLLFPTLDVTLNIQHKAREPERDASIRSAA